MTKTAETPIADRLPSSSIWHSVEPEGRSKSGLAVAGLASAVNSLHPIGSDGESVEDAFDAVLRSDLGGILASRPLAESGEDPEGIHQLRVALRRLRGSLALLGGLAPSERIDALRGEAKWLASGLGEARAWDVFLSETLPEAEQGCLGVKGFKELRDIAETRRAHSYDRARKLFADRRCKRFPLELASWITQRGWRDGASRERLAALSGPVAAFARPALTRQHAKVLRRGHHLAPPVAGGTASASARGQEASLCPGSPPARSRRPQGCQAVCAQIGALAGRTGTVQ